MIDTIKGGIASDHRGSIRFVNEFDMTQVKRFYSIRNADVELVRGWRAHRIEQRWFYVLSGSFVLDLVKIDDWDNASATLPVERRILREEEGEVLHVPVGYGTAFQAMEEGAELLVFADHGIEHAPNDDYTWPVDYFVKRDGVLVL
ncbi:WxcM-like domain-containing protein [Sphingobacterium yanglingense]|uniref:dTDP-4-dehydrorhamnose 3,5-epimerase n=1 Tax=Sphingobacterium yanglingense TaxID=1437280 RepID=A0A4R6W8C1_9SPHI|nr:WxcM-like domain-containing protein [Sphingobacterium yanglingense]TDQ73512.1 dTDP-4-dehydrorhamnose 3,5-epimerase [Sphingobacterium yanglingense]